MGRLLRLYSAHGGSAATGPALGLRIVGKGGYTPSTQYVNASSYVQNETRGQIKLGRQPVLAVAFVYGSMIVGQGTGEANNTHPFTLESTLESGVSYIPMTYGGASSILVNPGDIVVSDPVYASAFSLAQFAAGSTLWARTRISGAAGFGWPQSSGISQVTGEIGKASTTPASNINGTGALTVGTTVSGLTPAAIIGYWAGTPDISVLINGDSKITGPTTAKDAGATTYNGAGGFATSAFNNVSGGVLASAKISHSGDKAAAWNLTNNLRLGLMQYATHMISNYGVNDVREPRTYAQIIADTQLLYSLFRARAKGAKRIIGCTIGPNTTSTDSFATVANQSPYNGGFTLGGVRDQVNAAFLANAGQSGWMDELFDVRAYYQDQAVTTAWIADGNAQTYTLDGLHENTNIHALEAAALATRAASWTA